MHYAMLPEPYYTIHVLHHLHSCLYNIRTRYKHNTYEVNQENQEGASHIQAMCILDTMY